MTDWRSCLVVQDKDGDLWTNYAGMWHTPEMAPFSADILAKYDPTPVLDADGLPAVRTVGDLTARHIGRRVRVFGLESAWVLLEVAHRLNEPVDLVLEGVTENLHFTNVDLDTPCEVLDA